MAFAEIQAQIAHLTSLCSQTVERLTMQNVPTVGVSYGQGYQATQHPQRGWSDHSNFMWTERQQDAYWQPHEEYYQQPQEEAYWQPYEEYSQQPQLQDAFWQPYADYETILHELTTKTPNQSQNMYEQLMLEEEEEEEERATARNEPSIPKPPQAPAPLNSSKVVPNLIISNLVPPNAPFPCRFMQSTKDEGKKDILDTFPTIQEEEVVEERLEFIKEGSGVDHKANALKMPNLADDVPSELVECASTFEPILQPLGKPPTPIPIPISNNMLLPTLVQAPNPIQVGGSVYKDLRTDLFPLPYKDPMLESFEEPVIENVLEFLLPHIGKPLPKFSSSFYANMLLSSMIQAPTLEFKPLPDHFKYHLPFSDALPAIGLIQA